MIGERQPVNDRDPCDRPADKRHVDTHSHSEPLPGETTMTDRSSRREFLTAVSCASATIAGLGPTTALDRARPPFDPRYQYVDVHVHLGQPWNERGELTPPMLLRWMDLHQIERAWVLPLVSPEAWFFPITTEWVLEQTRGFRDRLIPFCCIDPRSATFGERGYFLDLLKRYQDAGARGFGEHKWGGPIDDPRNIELIGACAEVGFPVLFHLDNERNIDQPGLPGLERLLEAVPEAVMIGHGPGWWASISGAVNPADLHGYPKGPIAPGGALTRLLEKFPRLYADLSAGSGFNALRRDLEYAQRFLTDHADQILFGTDYLADRQQVPQFDLWEMMRLDEKTQVKIFRGNADRLVPVDAHDVE